MIKPLFAFLAIALTGTPAAAQDVQQEDMTGVWRGTVGELPVTACFDWRDWRSELFGVYYYDRHLRPISLRPSGDVLQEEVGYGTSNGFEWLLHSMDGDVLTGTWRSETSEYPITLERVDFDAREYSDAACESLTFNAPRMAGGSVVEEPAEFAGQGYTLLRYIAPPQFRSSANEPFVWIESFRLDAEEPGDAAVNAELARILDVADPRSEVADCLSGALLAFGGDGDFSWTAQPEVLTDRWLGVRISSGTYCGGAHPNYAEWRRVFDRQTGEETAADSWINSRGVTREQYESGGESYAYFTLTEELRALLVSHWPIEHPDDAECADAARGQEFWRLGLASDGMAFIPSMPHVMTVCANTVAVTWDELAPYLTEEGRMVAGMFQAQ